MDSKYHPYIFGGVGVFVVVAIIFALTYNAKHTKKEIATFDRGDHKDVCLPLPVRLGRLDPTHKEAQLKWIAQAIDAENKKVGETIFTKYTEKDAGKLHITVHADDAMLRKKGKICEPTKGFLNEYGVLIRTPEFGGPTKKLEAIVCFNLLRTIKHSQINPPKSERAAFKFIKHDGEIKTIGHELHHAWLGGLAGKSHPTVCGLMCKKPKSKFLSETVLTLARKVFHKCNPKHTH